MNHFPFIGTTTLAVGLKKGTTALQAVNAIRPILQYHAYDERKLFEKGAIKYNDGEIVLSETRLELRINSEIGSDYVSYILYQVAKNISSIAAESGEISLIRDSDDLKTTFKYLPSS